MTFTPVAPSFAKAPQPQFAGLFGKKKEPSGPPMPPEDWFPPEAGVPSGKPSQRGSVPNFPPQILPEDTVTVSAEAPEQPAAPAVVLVPVPVKKRGILSRIILGKPQPPLPEDATFGQKIGQKWHAFTRFLKRATVGSALLASGGAIYGNIPPENNVATVRGVYLGGNIPAPVPSAFAYRGEDGQLYVRRALFPLNKGVITPEGVAYDYNPLTNWATDGKQTLGSGDDHGNIYSRPSRISQVAILDGNKVRMWDSGHNGRTSPEGTVNIEPGANVSKAEASALALWLEPVRNATVTTNAQQPAGTPQTPALPQRR